MSLTCPIELDTMRLRQEISAVYTRVAAGPEGDFHFHRGPEYASTVLGYDRDELAQLPAEVTARFAGVGNPHAVDRVPIGATVLDVGCGAGMDLLLAARRVGPTGAAVGVDMTEPMRARAIAGAAACGLSNVDVRAGDATQLPVADASIDVLISNGVFNLVPQKDVALGEFRRVVKPGGRLQMADIVLHQTLSEDAAKDIDLWAG